MYDFHHQLAGLDGCQHVLAQGFFLHGVGEVFGYFIVDVGVQQGFAYVFKCFCYVDFGDFAFTFQYLERPFEAFTQVVKHSFLMKNEELRMKNLFFSRSC